MGQIIPPFRIKLLSKYIPDKTAKLVVLDVGCGSESPSITKKAFPNIHYIGVDIDVSYGNSKKDIECIDEFIQMDLNNFDSNKLSDNAYDIIIMSHIIEHLIDGDKIVEAMLQKLKKGGLIYIEFPSEKSVFLPSMKGTLNFFDDETHCRIYSIKEVCNLILKKRGINGSSEFKILRVGVVRQWINIFLLPLKVLMHLIKFGHCKGGIFWDLLGFANFVLAQKKEI
ncbi:MAG: hypothetical protein KatS3mg027_1160 [Bacteroidia bacterium]|nr:MAG: hypothetical protein KatS3mg027_1160 [Bacteroidia bacterium]